MPVAKKLLPTIWVSSALYPVGESPKWDWSQVVSCGRSGPALRPSLILSLLKAKTVAELLGVIWPLSLPFQSLSVVLSLKSLIVKRSICYRE